ncbi:hypothetical protein GCM10011415_09350 [Salipiger pallidus]|uniref:Uncharacterized protein n=1 Tax=Salipiger pallidus TaxID=1775170 RepID=A0A8J2ZHP1_9RHOB|nr:hypothetical protein GCM10011415_09350 [Salipiger pallidus]
MARGLRTCAAPRATSQPLMPCEDRQPTRLMPGQKPRKEPQESLGSLPKEFAAKMVEAGESKIFMSTKNTLIRA